MKKHIRYSGRQFLLFGAILLAVWMGYEVWVRLNDSIIWLSGVHQLADTLNMSFVKCLGIMFEDEAMQKLVRLLAYEIGSVFYALFVIVLRNRPRAAYAHIAVAIALTILGFSLKVISFNAHNLLQLIKLIPVAMIIVGSVMNLVQYHALRALKKKKHTGKEHNPHANQ